VYTTYPVFVLTHTVQLGSHFRSSLAYPCLSRPSQKSIRQRPGRQQLMSNGSDLHPLIDEREREVTSREVALFDNPNTIDALINAITRFGNQER